MFHQKIKTLFRSAVNQALSNISNFTIHPKKDMTRNKKLPPDKLISFLAADGSTFTFFRKPSFASSEYFVSAGHSAKGFYSMHLNAFFDLERHTYTDAIIQPVHQKDEYKAFCDIVDRHEIFYGIKNVYIGDRGYCYKSSCR